MKACKLTLMIVQESIIQGWRSTMRNMLLEVCATSFVSNVAMYSSKLIRTWQP